MKPWQRSNEPIAWSLFGAGGMVLGFLAPAMIVISGIIMPFVFADNPQAVYQGAIALLATVPGKLFLLVTIALPLYHCAHRLYHGLHDLHIQGPKALMLGIFYGGATVLSIVAGAWLLVI